MRSRLATSDDTEIQLKNETLNFMLFFLYVIDEHEIFVERIIVRGHGATVAHESQTRDASSTLVVRSMPCHLSSVVEQRFCKPKVLSSSLKGGSSGGLSLLKPTGRSQPVLRMGL